MIVREAQILWRFAIAALVWTRHVMASKYPGLPADQSIFIGSFSCQNVERGLRVTFTTWPTDAFLEYFPLTNTGDTCSGSYNVQLQGSFNGVRLFMLPSSGSQSHSCSNYPAVGFDANLASNVTLYGSMTSSSTCDSTSTISMERKIGYDIRDAVDYSKLLSCTEDPNAFQYSRAVFRTCNPGTTGCDPGDCSCSPGEVGCMKQEGATQVILPGNSEILAFTLPPSISNFELTLQGLTNTVPLGLSFVPGGNSTLSRTMWFKTAAQEVNPSPRAVDQILRAEIMGEFFTLDVGQSAVNCTSIGADIVGGLCVITPKSLPESLAVYVHINHIFPDASTPGEVVTKVDYSYYMWQNCTDVYPISATTASQCEYGCCPKDVLLAESAVQFWARQQRLLGLTTATQLMENYGLTSTEAGIPFYKWQAAWNAGLGSWSNEWSPYWASSFNFLDTNEDGYITSAEYEVGYNLQVGICPVGYVQTHPIVMTCSPMSGSVSFSLQDLPGNNTVSIPAGVKDLYLKFSSTATIDLRVRDVSTASIAYIVFKDGPDDKVPITKNKLTGSWGGVNITYVIGAEGSTNFQSVQLMGTLQKPILILAEYLVGDAVASYTYSTNGVETANCTSNIYENACSTYDVTVANVAVQVWSSRLKTSYADADVAWASTVNYRLMSSGSTVSFIPWGYFNQYWFSVFTSYRRLGALLDLAEGDEDDFGSRPHRRLSDNGLSLRGSSLQAFRYVDSNNDGYASESEFKYIYTSVPSCAASEYQAANLLLTCTSPSADSVAQVEPGVSLPVVIVPAGMTGLKLKATSTLHMLLSMESSDMAVSPNPASFSTKTPQSAASTVSSAADANQFFTVNIDTQDGSPNKIIEVNFQGTTIGTTTWLVGNNDTATATITLEYSFTNLSTCGPVFGCLPYNQTLASSVLQTWSSRIAGPPPGGYETNILAWESFDPQKALFGGIPQSTFPSVWCNSTELAAGCPNWLVGFKGMDLDNDMVISRSEFFVAYALSADELLTVSSLTDGCSVQTRYQSSDFPLSQIPLQESCHCSTNLAEGWDKVTQMCMKRRVTTCSQCSHQAKCAKIETLMGTGLQEFLGDCPIGAPQNRCNRATSLAFAYPTLLVVDEFDNIYLSDHGNNRVRVVNAQTKKVKTIAGTGEVGFAGDGGDGVNAKLRHPEGIAVNRLNAPASYGASTCTAQVRVVYFSDFYNQRVRTLTEQPDGSFTINTLLGNGERGENPICDVGDGCAQADVILNYPRSLALTRWGDLYIVDSGNRKVRRYRDGFMTTFLGSGAAYNTINVVTMRQKQGALLSGSWQEENSNALLNSIYTIQLDNEDNLWVVDGTNNRLLRAPLVNKTIYHTRGFIGRFQFFFQLHYGQLTNEEQMVSNMAKWLKYEIVDGTTLYTAPMVKMERGKRREGQASWLYSHPERGHWCEPTTRPDRCLSSVAQHTKFSRIMGLCFDAGNELYVVDQQASQIMTISADPIMQMHTSNAQSLNSQTFSNCPCLSYWVDWLSMGRNPAANSKLADYAQEVGVQVAAMCTENPDYEGFTIPHFMKAPCGVSHYCSSDAAPICFINTTNMPHMSLCKVPQWGFQASGLGHCNQEALPETTFKEVANTAILGHEIRRNTRCTAKKSRILGQNGDPALGDIMISWDERQLKRHFICDDQMSVFPYSMLLGFEEPRTVSQNAPYGWNDPIRPPYCTVKCCGLQNMTDNTGSYCAINNEADYQILLQYVNMLADTEPDIVNLMNGQRADQDANEVAKAWYGVVLVWSNLQTVGMNELDCRIACKIDYTCKAYVNSAFREEEYLQNTGGYYKYACTLYSETWPYMIVVYNTTLDPPEWVVTPLYVYSRLFNFDSITGTAAGNDPLNINAAYVNTFTDAQPPGYISGPHPLYALDINSCQNWCVQNENCTSVAYPGCYLFSHPPSYWESIQQNADSASKKTSVWVKEHISVKVSGVTGSPSVNAYSDDTDIDSEAIPALINRPTSCALDSAGNLIIADTWNHRLRNVSQVQQSCQYNMDLFTKEEVSDYRDRVNTMDQLCFTGSTAPFASTKASMQYGLLQDFDQAAYEALCDAPTPVVAEGINTKNLMVLCDVCGPLSPRPSHCPSTSLCNCRTSIVRVLASKVYLNCPTQSAYYEKWHKLATAQVACWMLASTKDTMFLGAARQNLVDALQNPP